VPNGVSVGFSVDRDGVLWHPEFPHLVKANNAETEADEQSKKDDPRAKVFYYYHLLISLNSFSFKK
jgi:hypothetical protein